MSKSRKCTPTTTCDPRNSHTVGVIDLFHQNSAINTIPKKMRIIKYIMTHQLILDTPTEKKLNSINNRNTTTRSNFLYFLYLLEVENEIANKNVNK